MWNYFYYYYVSRQQGFLMGSTMRNFIFFVRAICWNDKPLIRSFETSNELNP